MSRQAQRVRTLASTLTERTGVAVEADYDQHDRRWQVCWVDGPTVATMRTTAETASGLRPQVEVAELHWRRGHTDLAVLAAALAHLRQHPGDHSGLAASRRHPAQPHRKPGTTRARAAGPGPLRPGAHRPRRPVGGCHRRPGVPGTHGDRWGGRRPLVVDAAMWGS